MRKSYVGVRLRTLREQRGMKQLELAKALELSPSYLNQIENDQRPLTTAVLLRMQAALGIDPQHFSETDEAQLTTDLRDALADADDGHAVSLAEVSAVARQMPGIAKALLRLHARCRNAEERLNAIADDVDGERDAYSSPERLQPYEQVRDYFYARHNHMATLDERAEQLFERLQLHAGPRDAGRHASAADGDLSALLESHLLNAHGVRTVRLGPSERDTVRFFDARTRTLAISRTVEPGQRAFQIAIQIARLEVGDLIDEFASTDSFSTVEARTLARIGFANYFAGALLLPYRRFLADAQALRYDIEQLAERYEVSFETVCHRLSTMQRPDASGIPFFFVRVDRAGNISKRQSATDFHFSRTGGTCPLWNVYEAFVQPGKVLTQLSRMPDGRTYLWIARSVSHSRAGYGMPSRDFAVALGCDLRHAHKLVYAKGIDLNDPDAATLIGAGCKVCDREDCAQRAFPALGRRLRIDEDVRLFAPYEHGSRQDA